MDNRVLGLLLVSAVFLLGNHAVYAQSEGQIPPWMRSAFDDYADGGLSDAEMLDFIDFMIQDGIISVSAHVPHASSEFIYPPAPDDDPYLLANVIPGLEPSYGDAYGVHDYYYEDAGDFYYNYHRHPNSPYPQYYSADTFMRDWEFFESKMEYINGAFSLPYDVEISAEECGMENAYWDGERVVICYELYYGIIDDYQRYNLDQSAPTDERFFEAQDYADSILYYVFYHELAHALIDVYGLPIAGLEEDAADQFAALIMSYTVDEHGDYSAGRNMLQTVGSYYFDKHRHSIENCPEPSLTTHACSHPYWDTHGLDIQRHYNMLCYVYGSDPQSYQYLVDLGYLPQDRAEGCEYEYHRIDESWRKLLQGYAVLPDRTT